MLPSFNDKLRISLYLAALVPAGLLTVGLFLVGRDRSRWAAEARLETDTIEIMTVGDQAVHIGAGRHSARSEQQWL